MLKLVGGLYLVYLGIQTFRAASREEVAMPGRRAGKPAAMRALRQGVVVEATNPKTAAFFLAFIPQFIVVGAGHVALQFLVPGRGLGTAQHGRGPGGGDGRGETA